MEGGFSTIGVFTDKQPIHSIEFLGINFVFKFPQLGPTILGVDINLNNDIEIFGASKEYPWTLGNCYQNIPRTSQHCRGMSIVDKPSRNTK